MSFFAYKCKVTENILKMNQSLAKHMAGKIVYILPESVKYIPELNTFRFDILPENMPPEKGVSSICSRFLKPLTPAAKKILQQTYTE